MLVLVRRWPTTAAELIREQPELARAEPAPWAPAREDAVGGCFVCWTRGKSGPGAAGDRGWAAASVWRSGGVTASAVLAGEAAAPYEPGLLALREGPLLEAAVRSLAEQPDVLLVNATGRDHPRRAGLALHLGAVLELPTVGITHRLLVGEGAWPADERGATSPFSVDGERAGYWLRTRRGTRPLAVHAGWRIDPDGAVGLVVASLGAERTPPPLREARRLARSERARTDPRPRV
jgi:deoxyribonuclease V